MKKIVLNLIILSCMTILFSQVNFDLDFSFEKINPFDELTNMQVTDIDQNGESEIVCFYRKINNNGLMIVYDTGGNISIDQEFPMTENNEIFLHGSYFLEDDQEYILVVSNYEDYSINTKIKLLDFETFSIIDSCFIENPTYLMYTNRVNFCIQKDLGNDKIIYLGSSVSCLIDTGSSFLYKFLWNEQDEITSLSLHELYGLDYCEYFNDDYLILLDNNNQLVYETVYNEYSIALISHEIYGYIQGAFFISGYRTFDGSNYIYNYFPVGMKILNKNDDNYFEFGLLVSVSIYDYQSEDYTAFYNLSPDLTEINWYKTDSLIGIGPISASTCVTVNSEDHFVMYFRENQLEIRDRIDGDITHFQNSLINPFNILKCGNDELLFFEEQSDESGYNVYTLTEEILVSAEHQLPDIAYKLSNFPNPFNPETTIKFSIPQESEVELIIYNIKGQKVRNLSPSLCHPEPVEGRGETIYNVVWNGTNENNDPVSSGVYLYQLNVDGKAIQTKKMMLIK